MAQLQGIGPTLYTTLHYSAAAFSGDLPAMRDLVTLQGTNGIGTAPAAVPSIREFPSFGTPANIVNVPRYGSTTSLQIQGQADFPSLEFTLNYDPSQHAGIQTLVGGSDARRLFRITLRNDDSTTFLAADRYSAFFFVGLISSFEVTPSLTDSVQATLGVALQSDLVGPLSAV